MAPARTEKELQRVLVTGGRDYADRDRVYAELDKLLPTIEFLIHGDAKGADKLADEWAKDRHVPVVKYPARWDLYGLSAGPKRNAYMIGEQEPTQAIAFPGGPGTANCVRRLNKAGVPVEVIE